MTDAASAIDKQEEARFDYGEPAELYIPVLLGRRGGLDYRRFPTAALALQYAIESLAVQRLGSATLEVGGVRYDRMAMRQLYEAHFFPPRDSTPKSGNKGACADATISPSRGGYGNDASL